MNRAVAEASNRDELHAAVDAILNSGSPDAIGAMEYFLRTTKEQVESIPKRSKR